MVAPVIRFFDCTDHLLTWLTETANCCALDALSNRLDGSPHTDRNNKSCRYGDQIENAEKGQEAFSHNVSQRREDQQQHDHGAYP